MEATKGSQATLSVPSPFALFYYPPHPSRAPYAASGSAPLPFFPLFRLALQYVGKQPFLIHGEK